MTGRRLWTNAHDLELPVVPGPSAWHYCRRCKTRYRYLGRYVRRTTQPCPGCRLRREKVA